MNDLQKYYDNMIRGLCYIKGITDSETEKKVLASREGNHFSPETCFWAYKEDLDKGVFYIDGE